MPFLVPAQGAECLSQCGLRKGLHRPQGDPAGLGGTLWRKELRLPQALHPQAFIPPHGSPESQCCHQPHLPEALRGRATCLQLCPARSRVTLSQASLVSSLSGVWGLARRAVPDLAVPLRSLILSGTHRRSQPCRHCLATSTHRTRVRPLPLLWLEEGSPVACMLGCSAP